MIVKFVYFYLGLASGLFMAPFVMQQVKPVVNVTVTAGTIWGNGSNDVLNVDTTFERKINKHFKVIE